LMIGLRKLLQPHLVEIGIQAAVAHNSSDLPDVIHATYDPLVAKVVQGMPVYFRTGQVYTDTSMHGKWVNSTYPWKPAGWVLVAHNGSLKLQLRAALDPVSCNPASSVPALLIPKDPNIVSEAWALMHEAKRVGLAAANRTTQQDAADTGFRSRLVSNAGQSVPLFLQWPPSKTTAKTAKLAAYEPAMTAATEVAKGAIAAAAKDVDQAAAKAAEHVIMEAIDKNPVEDATLRDVVVQAATQAATDAMLKLADNVSSEVLAVALGGSMAVDMEVPVHTKDVLTQMSLLGQVDLRHAKGESMGSHPRLPLDVSAASVTAAADLAVSKSGRRVCVVAQQQQGRIFSRIFDLPRLAAFDRVLLQLVVTGHGWAYTSEQCGEFCHAVYRVAINGRSVANVTQWRNDCRRNPIDGKYQHGTWNESRNGWCPGSVEPGLFVDVTEGVHNGRNRLSIGLQVWSSRSKRYEPYTDHGGFALGDRASLSIGLSLMVFDAEAVAAAHKADPLLRTAAEVALLNGSSNPAALHPPALVNQTAEDASVEASNSTAEALSTDSPQEYGVETQAPWYLYNETQAGPLGESDSGTHRVAVFSRVLVQGATMHVEGTTTAADIPGNWSQVKMHIRLTKPPGRLDFDHWDRRGSIGLYVNSTNKTCLRQKQQQHHALVRLAAQPQNGLLLPGNSLANESTILVLLLASSVVALSTYPLVRWAGRRMSKLRQEFQPLACS